MIQALNRSIFVVESQFIKVEKDEKTGKFYGIDNGYNKFEISELDYHNLKSYLEKRNQR